MDTSIFIMRLLKFAKHLAHIKTHPRQGELSIITLQTFIGEHYRMDYQEEIPAWITQELAACFPEHWHFNKARHEHTLKGDIPDEAQAEGGIGVFFNMSEGEFLHAWCLECQFPTAYGGQELTELSGPEELAKNLSDLAAYRINLFHLN